MKYAKVIPRIISIRRWLPYIFPGLVFWVNATAQAPQLYFEKITAEKGLSHNKVNSITQDHRGFIWIGTDDGLNRFDGLNFDIFRHEPGNSRSISGNRISDLLEDEEGILWIATRDGGLTSYDYRLPPDRQFKQYMHLPGDSTSIPTNNLNALLLDDQGYLWIATNGSSLLRFDKKSGTFTQPAKTERRVVLALVKDKEGTLWAGRQGGGILKMNTKTLQFKTDSRYDDLYAGLPHAEVSSLYCDAEGNIWFGSWDKQLYRYNSHTHKEETISENPMTDSFVNDQILCLAENREGYLWLGGSSKGLQLYDKKTQRFYPFQHDPFREGTVSDNTINCLFPDKNGKMWVGTDKGISVSDPLRQQFKQTFLPSVGTGPSTIYCLYEDEKETLWIGTNNGLFFRKSGADTFTHRPLSYKGKELTVSSFFKDDDQLYIGTNYSLFRYDISRNKLKILPNTDCDQVMNGLIESRITSIVKDTIEGRPVLLVSPYGHYLTYYDLQQQRWVSRLDSTKNIISTFQLKDHLIRKLYKTSKGNIWLANTIGGLGEWVKTPMPKVQYYTYDPSREAGIHNNYIYDVTEGKDGLLWISTFGGGLHYMDSKTGDIRHITGSPNLTEGIQADGDGNVYFISNGKLHKYNPEKQLFSSIKLPDRDRTGGVRGNILKDNSGRLYACGEDYFVSFHPEATGIERPVSEVLLTDFRIFNTSYSHLLNHGHIRLPYKQNSVSFGFTAPNFSFSSPPDYLYKLEGVDKDWVEGKNQNTANYTNLQGGDYTFQVRVAESPEHRDYNITKFSITIVPPFWSRWWFYALCTVTIALIGYSIYRYRINELLKLQDIRNRIAQDLHDHIGSALSSILVYSEVAQSHYQNRQQTTLKKVLRKISSTSSNVISEMSDIVWAINPRNDSVQNILFRMESFAKPLAAAKQISLDINYDKALSSLNLGMEKRKNFYLIFKEAFNNAIKYAKAEHIDVCIQLKKKTVLHRGTRPEIVMKVQDDGKGFDLQQQLDDSARGLSGNGLNNMRMRACEMDGHCEIHAAVGKGTTVTLFFNV